MRELTQAIHNLENDIERKKYFAKGQYVFLRLKVKRELTSTKAHVIAFLTGSVIASSLLPAKKRTKTTATKTGTRVSLPQRLLYLYSELSTIISLGKYFKKYLQ